MLKPRWMYRVKFEVSQAYGSNNKIYADKHGALDIVGHLVFDPATNRNVPPKLYPILPGTTLDVSNSSPSRGKGIRVRTHLDRPFIDYLKAKGLVPSDYRGNVFLEHLYWHCLEILDLDGTVDQDTPIAQEGNTGWVFSNGVEVPDSQKGKPPYPGRHLHFECVVKGDYLTFNLDKDSKGRIDPYIIMAYEPREEDMFPAIQFKGEPTIYAQCGRTLFPFVSGWAFLHAGGVFDRVVPVDAGQKGNYDIRMESPITKS